MAVASNVQTLVLNKFMFFYNTENTGYAIISDVTTPLLLVPIIEYNCTHLLFY